MPILGVESITYGVDDLETCTRFFVDFGLPLAEKNTDGSVFRLERGARLILRNIDDPRLPPAYFDGPGIREIVWGVDSQTCLDALEAEIRRDREVGKGEDGVVRFMDDAAIPTGLRLFTPEPVAYAPDPVNAPDNIRRLNKHRKWRRRAQPKVINHAVFCVADALKAARFYRQRLNFRLSDVSTGLGYFLRADGCNDHHSIFFLQAGVLPTNPRAAPDHVAFGVEDIDEIMVGANHMERCGWRRVMGPGRHRISSALFYYLDCPAGGQVEYNADSDYLDDGWTPMEWEPMFGHIAWHASVLPFLRHEPEWNVKYLTKDPTAAQD